MIVSKQERSPRHSVSVLILTLLLGNASSIYAETWDYTMRPADTLWSVCKTFTNYPRCWLELGDLNGVNQERRISPGTVIDIPVAWLKNPPTPVTVEYSLGEVLVQTRPAEEFVKLESGQKLGIGAIIQTSDGTAKLNFADGSTLLIEPNSELSLDTLSGFGDSGMIDSSLRLSKGSVKTRVKPREQKTRFRIQTPSAVAAVRGTEYRVSALKDMATANSKTLTEVYSGAVAVNAQQSEERVDAGFGVAVREGEAPSKPRALLPASDAIKAETSTEQIQISWVAIEGAKRYKAEVYAIEEFENEKKLQAQEFVNTDRPELAVSAQINTCKEIRVFGVDDIGLQGKPKSLQACTKAIGHTPTLTVKKEDKNDLQVSIHWQPVSGAANYVIEVSKHKGFEKDVTIHESVEPFFSLDESEKSTKYVRVAGINAHAQTEFSKPLKIKAKDSHWLSLVPLGFLILVSL